MYLPAYVLGPQDQVEFRVFNYEAQRQRAIAQVAERREAAQPAPVRNNRPGWFGKLIPGLQH